jgi:hypothetical protein
MNGQPTLLAVLLEDKGLHRYGTFRAAYEKAARSLDRHLDGSAPSRAQFHRWLTGDLRRLPYTDHCRVLEQMLTGYSAGQLFQPTPDGGTPASARGGPGTGPVSGSGQELATTAGMADVAAVFASRSDFAANVEPRALFHGASRIRAAGLSLNLICQQVPDQHLRRMLADGAQLTCLFLDPDGEAIRAREKEEDHLPGNLSVLTRLNIDILARFRDRLPDGAGERLRLAVYDETIRFNLILSGDRTCVAQPYLPKARGVDSPTMLIQATTAPGGLFGVFERVYEALAERSKPV